MPRPDKSRPVALITGGTTGIGFATARLLHDRDFAVVVTGQHPERVAAAREALPSEVVVLQAEARSLKDSERIATELRERFGKLDLAFLNAGVGRLLPIEAVDEAFFAETIGINLKGPYFTLQKILPLLTKGSSVIFNASVGAYLGLAAWSVFSATKGAMLSLVHALSVELAPRGIRVNAIAPGPVDTPAWDKMGLPAGALEGAKDAMSLVVPAGRLGTAEEIANAVAFLGSPEASFITGTTLVVDGGLRATAPGTVFGTGGR